VCPLSFLYWRSSFNRLSKGVKPLGSESPSINSKSKASSSLIRSGVKDDGFVFSEKPKYSRFYFPCSNPPPPLLFMRNILHFLCCKCLLFDATLTFFRRFFLGNHSSTWALLFCALIVLSYVLIYFNKNKI